LNFDFFFKVSKRIFAVGGECDEGDENILGSIDIFDFISNTWRLSVTEIPGEGRTGLAVVSFRDCLYTFGGYSKRGREDRVDVYDNVHSTWLSVKKMPTPRSGHSVCLFKNHLIVVIGGHNRSVTLSSVDAFDALKNEWTSMQSMMTKRSFLSVVVLGGEIYAIGGDEGDSEYKAVNSVEKFDGIRWSSVTSMNNRRSGHCACVINDTIYVFGGLDENEEVLSSVESLSVKSDEWIIHHSSPMTVGRYGASAIVYEGRIYVVGAYNEKDCLNTTDVFDPVSMKWESITSKMTTPRAFAESVIM